MFYFKVKTLFISILIKNQDLRRIQPYIVGSLKNSRRTENMQKSGIAKRIGIGAVNFVGDGRISNSVQGRNSRHRNVIWNAELFGQGIK